MAEAGRSSGFTDSCPACGWSGLWKRVYREGEWEVLVCGDCGLGRTWPVLSPEDLDRVYAQEAYFRARKLWGDPGRTPFEIRARALRSRFGLGTLLDVGCGEGSFLAGARDAGFQAVGSELSEAAASRAREQRGLDIRVGSFRKTQFEEGERFGIITMYQVLEHLPDPKEALATARSLLEPQGILLVEVPNRLGLPTRFPSPDRRRMYDLPVHIFHFTVRSLELMLHGAGFKEYSVVTSLPKPLESTLRWVERLRPSSRASRSRESTAEGGEDGGQLTVGTERVEEVTRGSGGLGFLLVSAARRWTPGWKLVAEANAGDE